VKTALHILKAGGHLVNDAAALQEVLAAFAGLKGAKLLVHGGGRHATALAKQLGISPKMVNGRRITDATMLEVAVMSYAGLSNKKIVSQLQKQGVNAVFASLTAQDFVPVLCAITHDKNGQLLNTNADTIAAQVAIAMSKEYDVTLFYCFEHAGVLKDINKPEDVISELSKEVTETYTAAGVIHQGMVPKLHNGFDALQNGVKEVVISNVAALLDTNAPKTTLI
jgi:acetylglutamate kinase